MRVIGVREKGELSVSRLAGIHSGSGPQRGHGRSSSKRPAILTEVELEVVCGRDAVSGYVQPNQFRPIRTGTGRAYLYMVVLESVAFRWDTALDYLKASVGACVMTLTLPISSIMR